MVWFRFVQRIIMVMMTMSVNRVILSALRILTVMIISVIMSICKGESDVKWKGYKSGRQGNVPAACR